MLQRAITPRPAARCRAEVFPLPFRFVALSRERFRLSRLLRYTLYMNHMINRYNLSLEVELGTALDE